MEVVPFFENLKILGMNNCGLCDESMFYLVKNLNNLSNLTNLQIALN